MQPNLIFPMSILLLACACASTVKSPVPPELREGYAIDTVEAGLSGETALPLRYHEDVLAYLAGGITADDRASFDAHVARDGGLDEARAGDQFLSWLIETRLSALLAESYTGPAQADLFVEIADTSFPNVATMMVVGDLISVDYSIRLTDRQSGAVLLETGEPVRRLLKEMPLGGGIGGVVGLTIRETTDNRHVLDLESVADAIVTAVSSALIEDEIPSSIAKRLTGTGKSADR